MWLVKYRRQSLMIGNATIYCAPVVPDTVMVWLR
jgi:hypothetical protein